jgi:hypothetical protein
VKLLHDPQELGVGGLVLVIVERGRDLRSLCRRLRSPVARFVPHRKIDEDPGQEVKGSDPLRR